MYYEEAVVKEYSRQDGRPNKQINLGVNSKFCKKENVIVISSDNIETFKQNLEPKTKELEKNVATLQVENQQLRKNLKKFELEKSNFESEKVEYIETTNERLIEAKDRILELERQHADELKEKDAEIRKLNDRLSNEKDTSKTLLLALYSYEERGFFKGILNRTPQLAKQVLKENPKPIEVKKKE